MGASLLLAVYLLDPVLSLLLPVSRGLFAVFLLCYLWADALGRPAGRRIARPGRMFLAFAALGVAGLCGAVVSGTPVTMLLPGTLLLLALLWSTGARLPIQRRLLRPSVAMVGVVISHLALLLSLLGLDIYEAFRGVESNRAAGLFMEPSHFALYVAPLWVLAHSRRRYRPALYAMLAFSASVVFSLTLVLMLAVAIAVGLVLQVRSPKQALAATSKASLAVLAVIALLFLFGDDLSIEEVTLKSYVTERITDLFLDPDESQIGISSLAVLQGIDIAAGSVRASLGLGVGLGNLGINESINSASLYRELMNRATGDDTDLNLRDGGLLLNKLIGELGIFVLALAAVIAAQVSRIHGMVPGPARDYHRMLLALLVAQLFVRGLPYFSAPSCLMIVSMASLFHAGALQRPRPARARTRRQSRRLSPLPQGPDA